MASPGQKGTCGVCGGAIRWLPKNRWATTQSAYDVSRAWVRGRSGSLMERNVYLPHQCGDRSERQALANKLRVLAKEVEAGK